MQLKFVWSICFMLLWSMVGPDYYHFPPFQLNFNTFEEYFKWGQGEYSLREA